MLDLTEASAEEIFQLLEESPRYVLQLLRQILKCRPLLSIFALACSSSEAVAEIKQLMSQQFSEGDTLNRMKSNCPQLYMT